MSHAKDVSELVPCDACGAESGESCRVGCLGWAIDHDLITESGE